MSEKLGKVLVIGAGLAGSEAANYLANNNIEVILIENKTIKKNPAQKVSTFAELVCTNSLKSKNATSGHGLLKVEMRAMNSVVLEIGEKTSVPAGDALAVDRDEFSRQMTQHLTSHKNITVIEKEAEDPIALKKEYSCDYVVVASGPLTTTPLEKWIQTTISKDDFYFYDAIAPVVDADSLDYTKLYFKDRHKEPDESADYLNAPMNEEQYYKFVEEMVAAEKVPAQKFEDYKFFEACLPVDLMAERGKDTPRFSCMKPIGLTMRDGTQPYAVIQLRKENLLGSAFNLVGFQTRLKYPEQLRVFRTIPGFENATFNHLGSVHRNSFLNSRKLLNFDLSSKEYPDVFFAGQITGVEGYTESASMGLYVGFQILRQLEGKKSLEWPVETAFGALVNFLMTVPKPVPSSINFGLLPAIALSKEQRRNKDRKKIKKQLVADRALKVFTEFFDGAMS